MKCLMRFGKPQERCRAPQGARGLKFPICTMACLRVLRRAPQGARGLKLEFDNEHLPERFASRPARGAWVEISSMVC